ncbi:hypothetical protein MMC07_009557 [Pseudocyphellaria aurata]|nr:hypothetical protein [Pseudocyphellaria aurata]
MVAKASRLAPLLTNFITSISPASRAATEYGQHVTDMKIITVLTILCRSAHRNNSHYLPLQLALYLYSTGARVDVLALFNNLGLLVSNNVLQNQLANLASKRMRMIKDQNTNRKLVGTCDNFEYRENVHDKRVGDTVKFCSVTMALWIKNGWKISSTGLKQSMWASMKELPDAYLLARSVYGPKNAMLRKQCVWSHRFHALKAVFPDEKLDFNSPMPIVDRIDCSNPAVGATKAHVFAPSMYSESSTTGNISVFEDLNVRQMGIKKTDP